MTRAGRLSLLGAAAGLMVAGGAAAFGQELVRSEDAVVALFSLTTELEVDARMLRRMEDRLEENLAARALANDRVHRLYAELDALFESFRKAIRRRPPRGAAGGQDDERDGERDGESAIGRIEEQIEAKQIEVKSAERAETAVREDGHKLRDDIRMQRERMEVLSAQIDSIHASLPAPRDAVTGLWDITFLPSGDKGIFALFQSGTIVTGQYSLDGPFQGSLEGTLVDRRLLLHRIDSRLGRSMDLSASLSQDGQMLRGSWENYDLSNGQARTGSWAARRRPGRRAPGEGEGSEREGSPP